MQEYVATQNDAGLLREDIVRRYGAFFATGGTPEVAGRALRAARRLARLSGQDLEDVYRDLRSDALGSDVL